MYNKNANKKKFNIEIKLKKITISLHIDKKLSYFSYNYVFNNKDFIKLNIIIWLIISQKITNNYILTIVNKNF